MNRPRLGNSYLDLDDKSTDAVIAEEKKYKKIL
jgi:hypothetical protein